MPLPAAVRRPRRGDVAQGFLPASLVRCIGPWDGDEAGDIPIYRRGPGLHLVAILPHARRCDAGAVSGDRERPNHPHAPDPTVEIARCCVVRRMCTRANSGRRAGGCELREVSGHFSQRRRKDGTPFCFTGDVFLLCRASSCFFSELTLGLLSCL